MYFLRCLYFIIWNGYKFLNGNKGVFIGKWVDFEEVVYNDGFNLII